MERSVEILSPAGSYDSLKAAIAAGADAVYVGGARFGARAFADNFTEEELLEAIDYVHMAGKRIYLTINTLLKEHELREQLYPYLLPYYKRGIDAVIVQDIGVLRFVKNMFPGLPIHASTQMTITNLSGAKMLEELGVERVVTSRELQLDEIREIAEGTNLEIESFVHGALCYSYSGQCLYSSLVGGRSGNRGQCAQPCRLPYCTEKNKQERYLLSLKDICTLELIPDLVENGIYSFKIEGRMKKPEYVALVTAMYCKYVDLYLERGREHYVVAPEDKLALMDLYNRGGFHTGYYKTRNGREMVSIRRPNHAGVEAIRVVKCNGRDILGNALCDIGKGDVIELPNPKENYTFSRNMKKGETVSLFSQKKQNLRGGAVLNRVRNEELIQEIQKNIIGKTVKNTIDGKIFLNKDMPMRLVISMGTYEMEFLGDVCEGAINQPTDTERIRMQLCKTGNTPFQFGNLEVNMIDALFVPMQALNEIRRRALDALQEKILAMYRREEILQQEETFANDAKGIAQLPNVHVLVKKMEQFEAALERAFIRRIYVDCNIISNIWDNDELENLIDLAHNRGKEIYLAMPHIFRKRTKEKYRTAYSKFFAKWDGVLIRNYETYYFLAEHHYEREIVLDHHLYVFNKDAKRFWQGKGIHTMTAPQELNAKELQSLGIEQAELVIYGYQPMMVSAQCVLNTTEGCLRTTKCLQIEDRMHKKFSVMNYCDYCYNIVYNTLPLALFDQMKQIRELCPSAVRLEFTTENYSMTAHVLDVFDTESELDFAFTRGHFKRGIK